MSDYQVENKTDYTFHPDSAIKKFLMEISSPRLIGIINGILGKDYPTDSQVSFGGTESFTLTGNLDKNSRRCDLLVHLKTVEDVKKSKESKTLIELQSSKDKTMGFRMFIYALNVAEEDIENQSYTLPSSFTLYTTLDMPETGFDEAHLLSEDGEKLCTFRVPFYNPLATDFDAYEDSPLELLKLLYLYRYRKNPKLLKNREELEKILANLQDYALQEDGSDRLVISGLLSDMLVDVVEICKREEYWEELEIMETTYQTHSQMLVEKGEAIGEARGQARGQLEKSLEIAKNLLDILDNSMIALKTGLPLWQIEQLRGNP